MNRSFLHRLTPLLFAFGWTACTGNSDDEGTNPPPRDAGPRDGGDVRDAGPADAGFDPPTICDDLGLAERPFQDGASTYLFGDIAGDFTVTTLAGLYRFREAWTGCESYTFLNYIVTNSSTEEQLWRSDPSALVDTPVTAHYFFLSWERTDELRLARVREIEGRLNASIDTKYQDEANRTQQRARFHYVLNSVFEIPGSVGEFLLDYSNYQADRNSAVNLGDRGSAPPPLPFMFAIDRDQKWDAGENLNRSVGGEAAFEMASYLPYFFDYKANIRDEQVDEVGVETIVVLDDRVTEREFVRSVILPSTAEMASFDTLEVDVTVNCPHRNVFGCSEWDRIAHIFVCTTEACDTREELVRWITPYWRRGERRWVMDATSLRGLVASGGQQWIQVVMGPTWERATERDIRVALRLRNAALPDKSAGALRAFTGGNFDDTYNTRDPYMFAPPISANRVELVVILSGHGQDGTTNCAEWCDHRHVFSVNGTDLTEIRHEGNIGSINGCGPAAARGVPPGQWGNWAPERAYWCPGLPVDPIRIDITDLVDVNQPNTMTYSGNFRGSQPPGGGNITMSAYVVWYE